jgi:hypothetical protein
VVLPKSKVTEPKKLKRYLLYFIVALLVDCYIILRHYFDGYFPFLFAPYYDFARDHLSLDYGYYGTLSGLIMNPSFLLQAVILSLAVTAHFAYMARNYLWGEGSYVASVRDYGKSSKIALLISLGALIFCILTFLARLGLADPNKLDRFVANALLMLFFYSFGLASCLAVVFSVDSICKRQYSGKVVFIGVLGAILFAMFSFVIYLIIFHV